MTRMILAIATVAVFLQQTSAQKPVINRVYGPADRSCGAWTSGTPVTSAGTGGEGNRDSYLLWVEGYLSGAATALSTYSIKVADTDIEGIQTWMTNYCLQHPLDSIQVASSFLVVELGKRAQVIP